MPKPGVNKGRNNGQFGRPKTEIDEVTWAEIENYAKIGATKEIILNLLNNRGFKISESTLDRRIKEKYGLTFEEWRLNHYDLMRMSARGKIFQIMQKAEDKVALNAAIHIDKFINKVVEGKDEINNQTKLKELELKERELAIKEEQAKEQESKVLIDDDILNLILGAAEVEPTELTEFAEFKEQETKEATNE